MIGLWFRWVSVGRRAVVRREEEGVWERGVWFVKRALSLGNVGARRERDWGFGRRV